MLSNFLAALIDVYRATLSVFLGGRCRFTPSCSLYARQAVLSHGVFRGINLSIRRILKCHPWGSFGHDPVPELEEREASNG